MISVIIPLRDEKADAASRFADVARDPDAEILVADGGNEPATLEAFRKIGARILTGEGTRGARLAQAAGRARGDVLLFLHSDSRLPPGALEAVRKAAARGASAGAFSLAYEGADARLRWIAAGANLRSRLFGLPFGDQGLFVDRELYASVGGFRDLPICDDLDLVRRVSRVTRIRILPERTVTSPRRYRERGPLRQVLRSWLVQIGWFAGVSPERLERWYNPS
ncbi:MAG: TIGR04283 family arsenosugar biosynthesis glycosyltransferase [Acidobacteriota bacterium]